MNKVAPYKDLRYPAVSICPVWHGSARENYTKIFEAGYANLAKTDGGFFGKGLYGCLEAEYANKYANNCGFLVLNEMCFYSVFPVIDGDMSSLYGKGNKTNFDSHYSPVVSAAPNNPKNMTYLPCRPGQKHDFSELVTFESASLLPRYIVKLAPLMPKQMGIKSSAVVLAASGVSAGAGAGTYYYAGAGAGAGVGINNVSAGAGAHQKPTGAAAASDKQVLFSKQAQGTKTKAALHKNSGDGMSVLKNRAYEILKGKTFTYPDPSKNNMGFYTLSSVNEAVDLFDLLQNIGNILWEKKKKPTNHTLALGTNEKICLDDFISKMKSSKAAPNAGQGPGSAAGAGAGPW